MAIADALFQAESAVAAWAQVDPERGLLVDLGHWLSHFAFTACSAGELDGIESTLVSWLADDVPEAQARLFPAQPPVHFVCAADGTRCVSCAADLSDCEGAWMLELHRDPLGRLRIHSIVGGFAMALGWREPRPTHVDQLTGERWGVAAETGILCEMRAWLAAGGPAELRLERWDSIEGPPHVEVLDGARARAVAVELAPHLELCAPDHCYGSRGDDAVAVHYRRADGALVIDVVTQGPQECPYCPPEPLPR